MDHLVVPQELAGGGVQRHQRVPEEPFTLAVGTVEIVGGTAEGKKYHPALDIERHDPPDIGTRAVLPVVSFPGVVAYLARARHRVKSPEQLARAHIESTDGAARTFRRKLLQPRPGYDEVFIDGGRRSDFISSLRPTVRDTFPQVDSSTVAEALARFAVL